MTQEFKDIFGRLYFKIENDQLVFRPFLPVWKHKTITIPISQIENANYGPIGSKLTGIIFTTKNEETYKFFTWRKTLKVLKLLRKKDVKLTDSYGESRADRTFFKIGFIIVLLTFSTKLLIYEFFDGNRLLDGVLAPFYIFTVYYVAIFAQAIMVKINPEIRYIRSNKE